VQVEYPSRAGASRAVTSRDSGETETWELVAATHRNQQVGEQLCAAAAGRLVGGARPTKNTPVAGTALKLTPYTVLPGADYTASWGGTGGRRGELQRPGLQFTAGAGVAPAIVASPGRGRPGLRFRHLRARRLTIEFPSRSCSRMVGVVLQGGEFSYSSPEISSGGQPSTR